MPVVLYDANADAIGIAEPKMMLHLISILLT